MKASYYLSLFLPLAIFASSSRANDRLRLRSASELGGSAKTESAVKVKDAEVMYIDIPALERDYPEVGIQIRKGKIPSWEKWALDNYAILSERQVRDRKQQALVNQNEKVPLLRLEDEHRSAYAAVKVEGKSTGLISLKGIGRREDTPAHVLLTGLLPDSTGVAELARQKYLQRNADILNAKKGTDYQTGEVYFLIKFPFTDAEGRNSVVMGRQPQLRTTDEMNSLPSELKFEKGFTQQASRSGALTDFGNTPFDSNAPSILQLPPGEVHNDRPHEAAIAATASFHSGDKDAVQKHVDILLATTAADWKTGEAVTKSVESEIQKYREAHPKLNAFDQLLGQFFESDSAAVKERLGFSLELYFQRNPDVLEKTLPEIERRMQAGNIQAERGADLLARTIADEALFRHSLHYKDGDSAGLDFSPELLQKIAGVISRSPHATQYWSRAVEPWLEKLRFDPERVAEEQVDREKLFEFLGAIQNQLPHPAARLAAPAIAHLETVLDKHMTGWNGQNSNGVSKKIALELVRAGSQHARTVQVIDGILSNGDREAVFQALKAIEDAGIVPQALLTAVENLEARTRNGELKSRAGAVAKKLKDGCGPVMDSAAN